MPEMTVAENIYLGHLPARGGLVDRSRLRELAAQQLRRLGEDIDTKTRALALLNSESTRQPAGFSTRLRAFGARHIDGIWLDRLTLGATVESVSVSGSTLSPEVVPRYLRSLAADPALKGGQIDEFVIEKAPSRRSRRWRSFQAATRWSRRSRRGVRSSRHTASSRSRSARSTSISRPGKPDQLTIFDV